MKFRVIVATISSISVEGIMIGMGIPLLSTMLELGGKGGFSWSLALFFALYAALTLSHIIFVNARA